MNMKPILILPEGEMNADNLRLLNENGICTVECKNPAAVKFLDPVPSAASRSDVERAAIELSRKILSRSGPGNGYSRFNEAGTSNPLYSRADMAKLFIDVLAKGTPLDEVPTQQEQERVIFNGAKADEIRRLAKEEAKAERQVAKEAERAKAAAGSAESSQKKLEIKK